METISLAFITFRVLLNFKTNLACYSELSEHESQPEQEEAEKKVMRILYVNPDALHLTFVDHLRVAGAVWEGRESLMFFFRIKYKNSS